MKTYTRIEILKNIAIGVLETTVNEKIIEIEKDGMTIAKIDYLVNPSVSYTVTVIIQWIHFEELNK